ncbi:MAG: hypothetical protein AB1546_14975 [bacterium]
MRCRRCLSNEAAFFITGKDCGQVGLCYKCAEESGILAVLTKVQSVLHGYSGAPTSSSVPDTAGIPIAIAENCQNCGTTLREFERDFLFGCADCSHLFVSLIYNYLTLMDAHPASAASFYKGSPPPAYGLRQKLYSLQQNLKKTIEEENYREASRKHHSIQKLEKDLLLKRKKDLFSVSGKRNKLPALNDDAVNKLLTDSAHFIPHDLTFHPWIETAVEVRRNFAEFYFPHRMDEPSRAFLKEYLLNTIPAKYLTGKGIIKAAALNPLQKKVLEQRTVRRKLGKRATLIAAERENLSIIITDQDHLTLLHRIHGSLHDEALMPVTDILYALQDKAEMAFNSRFGYLTASPRYMGSGVNIYAILHLPFSLYAGRIYLYQSEAERRGVRFDTFSGTTLERHGFFKVSHKTHFGKTQEELGQEVFSLAAWLTDEELKTRKSIIKQKKNGIKKLTQRVIHHSIYNHRSSYQDVLRLVTFIDIALQMKILNWQGYSTYKLLSQMTSPYIQYHDGRRYTINECEKRRADVFSEIIQTSVRFQ